MEGKRNSFPATFLPARAQKHHYMRTSNANCFKIFHHVDLPDYLMFARDDRAKKKCTGMPEATCRAIVIIITPFVFFKMSLTCRDNFFFLKNVMTFKTCPLVRIGP